MKEAIGQVAAFHRRFGVPVLKVPSIPSDRRKKLRESLIFEEYRELKKGLSRNSLIMIADGLADCIYVLIGTALEYGIPLAEIFNEVHRANMRKVGGGKRRDGKILKPKGWKLPDIAGVCCGAGKKYGGIDQ